MRYAELFHSMHPGFFEQEGVRGMPETWVFTELAMDLRAAPPDVPALGYPETVTFGEYHGELAPLREAVAQVGEGWVQYFQEGGRTFCALDGERIVAFCSLADMGWHQGLHISGPGCVGTLPAYRERGIGLEMVRRATALLRRDGYDLSWIHYTHLPHWYARLGYEPVVRWGGGGIVWSADGGAPIP